MLRSPYCLTAALLLAAFAANPAAAWSQDAPQQQPAHDSLSRTTDSAAAQTVRAIGVVARRARYLPRESRSALGTATPLLETPQTVTVISRTADRRPGDAGAGRRAAVHPRRADGAG